jgi:hypothetical protein
MLRRVPVDRDVDCKVWPRRWNKRSSRYDGGNLGGKVACIDTRQHVRHACSARTRASTLACIGRVDPRYRTRHPCHGGWLPRQAWLEFIQLQPNVLFKAWDFLTNARYPLRSRHLGGPICVGDLAAARTDISSNHELIRQNTPNDKPWLPVASPSRYSARSEPRRAQRLQSSNVHVSTTHMTTHLHLHSPQQSRPSSPRRMPMCLRMDSQLMP